MEEHAGNYVRLGLHRQNMLRFSVDNIDGQVDTLEGNNLFHVTAISAYQRKPTMDDRAYLTEAQHPDSHLPSLSMAWLLCMKLVLTKVTLIIVKTFQHSLIAQLTTSLSATVRHTYSLMITASIR